MTKAAGGIRKLCAWSILAVATAVVLVAASLVASFPGDVTAAPSSFWE